MPMTLRPEPPRFSRGGCYPQYGALTEVRSDSKTFYNAGTVKYTRRLSGGLSVLGSYTFSRSIDQSFSSVAGNPSGEATSQGYCNLSQRGLSAADRRPRVDCERSLRAARSARESIS